MASEKTYSRSVFGLPDGQFEGIEQGFDPCAEPRGRVQKCMDADFYNGKIRKRKGNVKYHSSKSSVISMTEVGFPEETALAYVGGDGYLRMITNMPSAVTSYVDLTEPNPGDSSSSSSLGFSSASSVSSASSSSSSLGFSTASSGSTAMMSTSSVSSVSSSSSSLRYTSSSTSNAGAWYTTLTATQTGFSGYVNYSGRVVYPAASLSVSGTKIRVTMKASTSGALTIKHVSIVERSGTTADGTTTPTEIKFAGASGFTIGTGLTVLSDETVFTLDETKDYLMILDFAVTGASQATELGGGIYYKAATESWDQQTVTGFSGLDAAYRYVAVEKIEVFA